MIPETLALSPTGERLLQLLAGDRGTMYRMFDSIHFIVLSVEVKLQASKLTSFSNYLSMGMSSKHASDLSDDDLT